MAKTSVEPEVETFNELLPTIQTAITMGVQPLATQAFSCSLITRQQLNTCTHMMYTPDQQANHFLQFIGTQIDANPAAALGSFRNILDSDSVYDYLVKKIGIFGGRGTIVFWVGLHGMTEVLFCPSDNTLELHKRAARMKKQEPSESVKESKKKQSA